MIVETFPTGPLGCNCSLLIDPASKSAVVVDPGGDFDVIEARLASHGAKVAHVIHTHTHIDHVGATAPLQRAHGATAQIHEADRFLYDLLPVQAAMLGVPMPEKTEMEGTLRDGGTVTTGGLEVGVIHTPGHTPGSCSFVVRGGEGGLVLTGDTLFRQGIGRTDLWGGDFELIMKSLHERLLTLGDDLRVITGHGPETTIGAERRDNPFLR